MTKDQAYFTYAHCKQTDGSIFYIGKGKRDRIISHASRNNYWKNIVSKHGLRVMQLARWKTEQEAFDHEKFLIWCFKDMGLTLVNMTDGGEGLSNPSLETRKKMSDRNAMKRPEISAKISVARKGKLLSVEHRKKLSEVQSGRKLSESTKKKMSNRYANGLDVEYRKKLSESAKKAWAKRKGLL